jgi:hypothetical protein
MGQKSNSELSGGLQMNWPVFLIIIGLGLTLAALGSFLEENKIAPWLFGAAVLILAIGFGMAEA